MTHNPKGLFQDLHALGGMMYYRKPQNKERGATALSWAEKMI